MVKIIGNINAQDDLTHELGAEKNFNESVYFNFFDPAQNCGGFVRIGNRANEGYAEMTVIVWNADGSALFNYNKPAITHNEGWNAGGLKIDVLVPAEKVRTTFTGEALYLKDPTEMQDPSQAFKSNPRQMLHIDLTHEAVGPFYGHIGEPGDGNEFARAHTEQHMRVSGSVKMGDEPPVSIAGWGIRDHSWGPRFWQAARSYRWITGNFGDDLGMVITTNGDGEGGGVFQQGDELVRIKHAKLSATYAKGTQYHRALSIDIEMENNDKRVVEGRVMGFIPLRNRRAGAQTHVGEGMTEYVLDGERKGYGLSEFLNQEND